MMIDVTRKKRRTKNRDLSYRTPKSFLSQNINHKKRTIPKQQKTTTFIISPGYHIDNLEVITTSRFVGFCLNHILSEYCDYYYFFLFIVIQVASDKVLLFQQSPHQEGRLRHAPEICMNKL